MLHSLGLLCKYVLANFKSKKRTLKASEVITEFIARLYSAQGKCIYNKPHSSIKYSEATSGGFSIHLLCMPSRAFRLQNYPVSQYNAIEQDVLFGCFFSKLFNIMIVRKKYSS